MPYHIVPKPIHFCMVLYNVQTVTGVGSECVFRKLAKCLSYSNVSGLIRSFTYLFVLRPFFLLSFFYLNTFFCRSKYIPLRLEKPRLEPELLHLTHKRQAL
jgi:hypothetical protein